MGIPEKIKAIQDEIHKTQINKATEFHIGLLKAKIARLRREMDENTHGKIVSTGGASAGFDVRKAGDATVVLIGLPSVGKSTLLNALTNAKSRVASYQFTTLTAVPGMMDYSGSKIQILDMPGIIEGAASGKGLGKRVLSVARSADLVLMILDVFQPHHFSLLKKELSEIGIKIDLVNQGFLKEVQSKIGNNFIPISADANINISALKQAIYQRLDLIRIYLRTKTGETDYEEPLIIRNGSSVATVCNKIHRKMTRDFKYAQVWGRSSKFGGQKVGLDHTLVDQDVLTITKKVSAF